MSNRTPWPVHIYRNRLIDLPAYEAWRRARGLQEILATNRAMKQANARVRKADPFAADVVELWEKTSKADLFVMCLHLAALATGSYDSAIKDNNAEGALRRMLEERFCALNKPSRTFPRQPARED